MIHITKGFSHRSQQTLCGEPMQGTIIYLTRDEARNRAIREGNTWRPRNICTSCMNILCMDPAIPRRKWWK
jgi:hypothetical protein